MRKQCINCGFFHDPDNGLIYPDLYRDSDPIIVANTPVKATGFCPRPSLRAAQQLEDRNYCEHCDCECDYCTGGNGCTLGRCRKCRCVPANWCQRCNHACPDCPCATGWCEHCNDEGNACGAEHEIPGHKHLPTAIKWISDEVVETPVGGACGCDRRNGCDRRYPEAPNNKPYLGLEIELEGVDCKPVRLAYLWNRCGLGWAKRDGSLADGVECVTFPITFEALVASDFANLIDEMRKMGARAWDTRTCGLHIHINKAAFTGRAHQWRFAAAHLRMAGHLRTLAGRASTKHSQWPDEYNYVNGLHPDHGNYRHPPTDIIAGKALEADHYSAISMEHPNTIELRFWRGTTLSAGIMGPAAIESGLFYWSKSLSVREFASGVSWENFLEWTQANRPIEFAKITDFMDLRTRYMSKIERNAKLCA
jgi:hypothetical protein